MSIFSSLQPEAHLNKNVFDRSRRDVFSLKTGMIVPFFVEHTIPDSVYDLSVANQIELSPMMAANFARMSQQAEFYFVPYSQLWRWFESFYYQRMDTVRNPHGVQSPKLPKNVPTFNLWLVYVRLSSYYFSQRILLDICRNCTGWIPSSSYVDNYLSMSLEAKLYKLLQLIDVYPSTTLTSYFRQWNDYCVDVHGRAVVEDILRNFDLLGYGNLLPRLKPAYIDFMNKVLVDYNTHLQANNYDDFITEISHFDILHPIDQQQLFDFLNDIVSCLYGLEEFEDLNPFVSMPGRSVSAWPILAYLKIFSDNFRNVQYDDENYSYYYNIDNYLADSTGYVSQINQDLIIRCLMPRYRLYRRDILTGTYPTAQFGDVSVASLQNPTTIKASAFDTSSNKSLIVGRTDGTITNQTGDSVNNNFVVNSGVSALAIRQAEALQRWKEKNLRAGNRLVNQQKAMFGDSSFYLGDDYSHYIGGFNSDILINTVAATSESGDYFVGEKASNGASAVNNNISRFKCHDFGVIIGVMYILPRAEYESFGLDPQCRKIEPFDFYNSAFQNLGLSAVDSSISDVTVQSKVLGYSSRFWEYKTAIDRVHGEFSKGGSFNGYVTPRDSVDFNEPKLNSLYVNPSDVDDIFYMSASPEQDTDQFKVNSFVSCKAVLPMSVTGLPY